MSRCLLIEFQSPCLEVSLTTYSQLPSLLANASSGAGLFISLGEAFMSRGIQDMDSDVLPKLRGLLGVRAIPRVLPSMLYYFGSHYSYIQVC